ncbi:MAG: DUF3293 domain-containing protein [Pseudomonadota bacterium]
MLKVNMPCNAVAALLRVRSADCAALITAFNPQGRRQTDAANRAAQELLKRDLDASGLPCLRGRNEDSAGQWPEDSFLVLGLTLPTAHTLAARYGQLAFLWMDVATATPRLVETAASD